MTCPVCTKTGVVETRTEAETRMVERTGLFFRPPGFFRVLVRQTIYYKHASGTTCERVLPAQRARSLP